MKNVRLFAVAAALGMFASTVAAAETTKTTVQWTGEDTIIKVDIGEKLIAPKLSATVTVEKEATECEGDTNGDGYIDGEVYAVDPTINAEQGWLFTNAKYWPTGRTSVGTAKHYLGLNGARILTPGEAENEGSYVVQLAHKNLADVEAVYAYLEEQGVIETIIDEEGEVVAVKVGTHTVLAADGKTPVSLVEGYVKIEEKRKAFEAAQEEIVNYFVNGVKLPKSDYYTVSFSQVNYLGEETPAVYNVDKTTAGAGDIVLVSADRRGNYSYVGKVKASSRKTLTADETKAATGSDLASEKLGKGTYFLRVGTATDVQFTANSIVTLAKAEGTAYDTTHAVVTGDKAATGVVINNKVVDITTLSYYDAKKQEYVAVNTLDADEITPNKVGTQFLNGNKVVTVTTFVTDADYDYADKAGNGYVKASAESVKYGYWTVDGENFYAANTSYTVFESKSKAYNDLSSLGAADKITIVEVDAKFDASKYFNNDGTAKSGVSQELLDECYGERLSTVTPVKNAKGDLTVEYTFNLETLAFEAGYKALNGEQYAEKVLSATAHTEGIFYVTSPENDSDLYVLLTTDPKNEYVGGVKLENWNVNKRTEKGWYELEDENDTVLDTLAVELDGIWYPAFESEEKLVEFMYAVTGLNKALEGTSKDKKETTFKTWFDAAEKDLKAGIGELPEGETLPVTAIQPVHGAKACELTSTVSSDKVTVDVTNLADIDTEKAGVYDLTYSATYENEVVGTTSIKVVVAPNYTREWKNGKVVKLTSYYVNKPTQPYAVYEYDWAAGQAVVTYYDIDGAVADTATVEL